MYRGILDSNIKIVTSGLVLYLDASQKRSYPGSSGTTTWYDLSGNGYNGTLTNGASFDSGNGGSIVFDGTNDYVQVVGSITTSTATFIVWLKRNGDQGQFDGILYSRSTNVTGMDLQSSNQLAYTWNGAANTFGWISGLILPNLSWCMCAISVSASSATGYLCQSSGITSAVNSVSHTSTVLDDINVGRDDQGGREFNGNITIAQIYNRALSSTEITQNFNVTKARFGL